MKAAIIGVGMVGTAVFQGSKGCTELCTYDKFHVDRTQNWDRAWQTDLCFICVPTPTALGVQDLSAVSDACRTLRGMSTDGYKGVVVIKSTVLPGTMRQLQNQFPDLRFVHNPEFLCERTAIQDYANQKVILLSGKTEDVRVVRIYADLCLHIDHAHYTERFEDTEWAKYLHNCVLPVKLSFLNEMYDLIGDQGTYDEAISMAKWFGNVGELTKVPGPDGQRGWGGACFPKDTLAMHTYALARGMSMPTLAGAIQTNDSVRSSTTKTTTLGGIKK